MKTVSGLFENVYSFNVVNKVRRLIKGGFARTVKTFDEHEQNISSNVLSPFYHCNLDKPFGSSFMNAT